MGLLAASCATPAVASPATTNPFGWPPSPCHTARSSGAGRLLLLVRQDESDAGYLTEFYLDADGRLYAGATDIELWVGEIPQGRVVNAPDGPWYPLSPKLAGRYRLDACTQTLWLAPLPQAMPKQVLDWQRPPPYRLLPRATGAFINVDAQQVVYPHAAPQTSAVLRAGAFTAAGVGDSAWLFDGRALQRLDTRLIFDAPAQRRRVIAGDTVTLTQGFTTPARFGGVQYSSDFALDPDLDPLSVPSINGQAALPSTLDLYENGVRLASRQVGAGPFQISNLPIVNGTGQLQVVVRDAVGRITTITAPFYRSVQLLKPQLYDYSVEAGWLRQDFALPDDRYTDGFVAAGSRYGWDSTTTVGARGEVSPGLQDVSAGLAHAWPGWVLLNIAGTISSGTTTGVGGTIGLEHNATRIGFGARLRLTSTEYRELGNSQPPRRQLSAYAFFRPSPWLGLQVNYSELRRTQLPRLRLFGAALSASLPGDWFASLGLLRALPDGTTVSLNLVHRFGQRGTLSLGGQRDSGRGWSASAAVQQVPAGTIGTFYNAFGQTGRFARQAVQISEVRPGYGLGVDLETVGGDGALRLNGQSGLTWIDKDLFVTRQPQHGVAVVDIPGAADVEIQRDNLAVGRTDEKGRLLISNLTPYAPVTLAPELSDLPPDLSLIEVRRRVAIPSGGAVVRFESRGCQVRRLHLLQVDGTPVPAGAQLRVDGRPAALPVGYGGLVYLDVIRAHRVSARWSRGRCQATIPRHAAESSSLICRSRQ